MRSKGLTLALTVTAVLCLTACGSTRRASERFTVQGAGVTVRETGDSLREEISRNLNENLAEHEVVRETIIHGDSVKVERITERTTTRGRTASTEAKREQVKVVRDTVIVQWTDTVRVERSEIAGRVRNEGGRASPFTSTLKWIFWIIIGLIGLTITVKVCSRKR